jgi:CxxC motif-containing protein
MKKNITCISCPVGCPLTVTLEGGEVTKVEGQGCPRGEVYAKKECVNPTRIFTSSVPVEGGFWEMVSVKTAADVPKSSLAACVEALKGIRLTAPVAIGDVVVANVAGTGVDIVATREVAIRH